MLFGRGDGAETTRFSFLRNNGAQPGSIQFDGPITASAMSLIGTERHANHNDSAFFTVHQSDGREAELDTTLRTLI